MNYMKPPEKITAYRCADGRVLEDLGQAEQHDVKTAIDVLTYKATNCPGRISMTPAELGIWLRNNARELAPIMNRCVAIQEGRQTT